MHYYPPTLVRLIQGIAKLPGIGQKTAERLALHLMRAPKAEVQSLAAGMLEVKERTRLCERCFGLSDVAICGICRDAGRQGVCLCVVEQPGDMVAIEKSGAFKGLYHVLGGVLSPLDGVGPHDLRIKELLERVQVDGVEEVVLATSTRVEGDATADFLAQQLIRFGITVSRIASGVPIGGDLKFVDEMTLRRAMEGRHAL